jgi:hypothetical protein
MNAGLRLDAVAAKRKNICSRRELTPGSAPAQPVAYPLHGVSQQYTLTYRNDMAWNASH